MGNHYANKTTRQLASQLVARGVTPAHISQFITARRQETFWRGKTIPFATVANDIGVWLADTNRTAPQQPARQPSTLDGSTTPSNDVSAQMLAAFKKRQAEGGNTNVK